MDRRIAKTKILLENSLIKLMIEKGFDKISIKDLCQEADINRGTFYLHYKDKYDLLEQKEDEILNGFIIIVNNIVENHPKNFILPANKEILLHIFTNIYIFAKENADFMRVVLGANGDLNFQMKIRNTIETRMVEAISINSDIEKMPIKYLAPFASSAQLGIIQKWLKSGMKETPGELAAFVSNIIFTIYNGAIRDMLI